MAKIEDMVFIIYANPSGYNCPTCGESKVVGVASSQNVEGELTEHVRLIVKNHYGVEFKPMCVVFTRSPGINTQADTIRAAYKDEDERVHIVPSCDLCWAVSYTLR